MKQFTNIHSVFYNPYRFRYAPFKWLKSFFRSFRMAYQRAVQGWCASDIWDFDSYLAHIIGEGLDFLADNHCGFPGDKQFPTEESWTKWLKSHAEVFKKYGEDNDEENPYAKRYWTEVELCKPITREEDGMLHMKFNDIPLDLKEKYYYTDRAIHARKMSELRIALDDIGERWESLWD